MTDVDATAEINGRFLFMEFKSGLPRDIPTGQRIYFQRLTALSKRITCFVVCADAATMECRAYLVIYGGRLYPWRIANAEQLKERVRSWVQWARTPPANDESA